MNLNPKRIAIITGWSWSERGVSLRSAEAVRNGLATPGHSVTVYDFPADLHKFLSEPRPDFAFVMMHGKDGEDGKIPAILDLLGIPYQGADHATHALCMDKIRTKAVWKTAGIPVAKDAILESEGKDFREFADEVRVSVWFPAVIKVPTEWSSNGVHIVASDSELEAAWPTISAYHGPLLVEECLEGREITVSVLDFPDGHTVALPIIEIIPPEGEGFDFENKYNGKTREICPAEISAKAAEEISAVCLEAYRVLGVSGYGRIDAMLAKDGSVRLLELNSIPGFTDQSLFPLSAKTYWLWFPELLEILMDVWIQNFQARQ